MLSTRSTVFSAFTIIACCCGVANLVLFGTNHFFYGSGGNHQMASSESGERAAGAGRKLAVVVPMYDGDVDESFDAMRLWPTNCSPLNVRYTDLVIYSAEPVNEHALLSKVPTAASMCFRRTKVVSAGLTAEENVYPRGPSSQFYKLFLDPEVSKEFELYDALAIIESDVAVTHETSFERLYKAAFTTEEPFWMKGSTLDGAEFHETAMVQEMWHIIGHLNGNAIYNNKAPAFAEFVNFTLHRWEYDLPYDVALWATIADFPYTWPLWQRFASNFVVTNLISNVGFYDVSEAEMMAAVTTDTLFVHGSNSRGGSVWNTGVKAGFSQGHATIARCTTSCGTRRLKRLPAGMSTTCDDTCWADEKDEASRFDNHLCGDSTLFGDQCRLCYTDRATALRADRELAQQYKVTTVANTSTGKRYEGGGSESIRKHVIMCDTKRPPEALECTPECAKKTDTVCDQRCGTNHFQDLHCNWRALGKTCRFCFTEHVPARIADEIASARGSRVIMCNTHEPPVIGSSARSILTGETVENESSSSSSDDEVFLAAELRDATGDDPRELLFTKDIARGEICVFVPGYLEYLAETNHTVNSVLGFMPGVRVSIATGIIDFHVYNRTVGQRTGVHVWNSSYVDFAALQADRACGNGTKLIYYMSPGQVLSREFTSKDTHSARGDLLVSYTEVDKLETSNALRATISTLILGFNAPSFTYGTDLILPADTNAELRKVLLSASSPLADGAVRSPLPLKNQEAPPTEDNEEKEQTLLRDYVVATASIHQLHTRVYVPELLAALSYSRNTEGVVFHNPTQWTHHHFFEEKSIWDIPLVKPHFSCALDIKPSLQGLDVAEKIRKWLDSFRHGARCERGFVKMHKKHLNTKPNWEFGPLMSPDPTENERTKLERMPSLKGYNISVMFRTFVGDAVLFNVTLPTVSRYFPDAKEIVVVVEESDGKLFEKIIKPHQKAAPFAIRLVTEPNIMDGHIQQKYSKLRADLYCEGDFVLHLDSDVVLFEPLTYDHIFHWGKPVLPFRRYREEVVAGQQLSACWRKGTSFAVGEDVVHEFSIFNTHVYPRKMYPAIRGFMEQRHGMPFEEFMASRRGKCMSVKTLATWTLEEQTLLLSDFNLMGAYLWYHMHDEMHWMATDPYDMQVDEWRRDVTRYAWVCQANGRHVPEDKPGEEQYIDGFLSVSDFSECVSFKLFWKRNIMKNPETREPNPPRFQEEY
ncbi:unnamed protein product [Ectocarpus sp. 6 AP-2014]